MNAKVTQKIKVIIAVALKGSVSCGEENKSETHYESGRSTLCKKKKKKRKERKRERREDATR